MKKYYLLTLLCTDYIDEKNILISDISETTIKKGLSESITLEYIRNLSLPTNNDIELFLNNERDVLEETFFDEVAWRTRRYTIKNVKILE